MSGIQEILLLVIIILGIFFIPRMMRKGPQPPPRRVVIRPLTSLSVRVRLAIVLTILWPLLSAAYFQPWAQDLPLFLYIGLGPVIALWALAWIIQGLKGQRKT